MKPDNPQARFLTDGELRQVFGLTENALKALRKNRRFPRHHPLFKKTDRRAVDLYFDNESGIGQFSAFKPDGKENFGT
ncbi:MAG: hypothetical protein HRU27_19400 [Rhizobiaceae bacterium]|nr:hypothetical protein [Hyphomicrobiales bacterium]NRB32760.1 hypothetical protein [Rhizobiaceae bacterium]